MSTPKKKPSLPRPAAQPIRVDGTNRRSDDDALEGHFVDVIAGEFTGRHAAYLATLQHSDEDGYPTEILIRTRDDNSELIALPYKDVRPARTRGGR